MKYIDKKKSNNILLIDINVPDYQEVVDSVNSNTLAIVYDYNDTYEDLSNILQNYDISRVGVFFESTHFLNGSFFETTASMIDLINHHKIPQIDYLACNTLNYPEWTNYYKQLPCIVGASNNETGNTEYGGDWIMESTGENIESTYFSDIKYKHLLGLLTKEVKTTLASSNFANGLLCLNTATNNIFTCCFSNQLTYLTITNGTINATQTTVNASPIIDPANGAGPGICAIYTSNYIHTLNGTNKWVIFIVGNYNRIYLWRGFSNRSTPPTQSILVDYPTNFNRWNGIAIYNKKLFFSTGSNDIYTATITDSTDGATYPTCGSYSSYITSATLSLSGTTVSSTYYPMQMTCDTNGLLYIVMGYTDGTPTTSDILVYNITGVTAQYVKKISFNDVFSQVTYGSYYSLKWYNNILYIGTYKGSYSSSTTGYLFAYNTLTNAVKLYTTNETYAIGGIDIDASTSTKYLLTSSMNRDGGVISTYNLLDTFSGFYYIKSTTNYGTYGIDTNSIVL